MTQRRRGGQSPWGGLASSRCAHIITQACCLTPLWGRRAKSSHQLADWANLASLLREKVLENMLGQTSEGRVNAQCNSRAGKGDGWQLLTNGGLNLHTPTVSVREKINEDEDGNGRGTQEWWAEVMRWIHGQESLWRNAGGWRRI